MVVTRMSVTKAGCPAGVGIAVVADLAGAVGRCSLLAVWVRCLQELRSPKNLGSFVVLVQHCAVGFGAIGGLKVLDDRVAVAGHESSVAARNARVGQHDIAGV